MSIVNLQDKPIVVNKTPVEIDFAVNEIRKELANLEWVSHPYFIAQRFYRRKDSKVFFYPETYAPDAIDSLSYHRLTPDNDYSGMFFFMVGTGRQMDYSANQTNYLRFPVSIIFSVNLKLIDECKLAEGLFTQELIRDVRRKLTTTMIKHEFHYELISETRDLRETYKEFRLEELERYNRAPLQCFRMEMNVIVEEDCD